MRGRRHFERSKVDPALSLLKDASMVIGLVMFLAGLVMIYLAFTDVSLGEIAKQIASGQAVTVGKK